MESRKSRSFGDTPFAGGTTLIRTDPGQDHGLARVEIFVMLDEDARVNIERCHAHVQLPLPPEPASWDADLSIRIFDGEAVITSLTITPALCVPKRGLRTEDLRSLALSEIKTCVVRYLRDPENDVLLASKSVLVRTGARAPGRRTDLLRLARLSDLYARATELPGRTYENFASLAADEGFGRLDYQQLRNEVERAREKGILSRPGSGRRPSSLTDRGHELLLQGARRESLQPGATLADEDSEFPDGVGI